MEISIVKSILEGNFAKVQEYCDKVVADKICERINQKKIEVLSKINGKTVSEMVELMVKSSDTE